jgi:hypothetical protein
MVLPMSEWLVKSHEHERCEEEKPHLGDDTTAGINVHDAPPGFDVSV